MVGAAVRLERILLVPATPGVLGPDCRVGLASRVSMVLGGRGAVGLGPFVIHRISPASIGQPPSTSMYNPRVIRRNSPEDRFFPLQIPLQMSPPTTV